MEKLTYIPDNFEIFTEKSFFKAKRIMKIQLI